MTLEEIIPGMVFREHDYRACARWVRILEVQDGKVLFDTSAVSKNGPFDLVRRKSKRVERFHKLHNQDGFRLEKNA